MIVYTQAEEQNKTKMYMLPSQNGLTILGGFVSLAQNRISIFAPVLKNYSHKVILFGRKAK